MIPTERLEELKHLFAEDGITLTDAEALEIGLWLIERIRPIAKPVPLDNSVLFATIKREVAAIRRAAPFVNLSQARREKCKH
jgi:hypothetical protein